MRATVSLTLIGKPDCHLCDDARAVVNSVIADLETEASAPPVTLQELSILDDSGLREQYLEEIPVLMVNGRVHNIWRIDPVRLRSAILDAG